MAAAIDPDGPDPHAPAATSGINNDSGKRVILNELLSFVAYKLNIMPPDTIIQLCASFYSDDEVDTAKILLFDLCADQADRQDRLIKRSGQKKKQLSLKDIVSLFVRKHDAINAKLCFAAADLGRLPPIGFDSIDVCTLLAQLQATMADLEGVKANVAAQAIAYSELQSTVARQGGLCTNLSDTVSAIVAKSVAAVGEPEPTRATSTRPDLPVVSAVTAVPVQPVRAAPPQPTAQPPKQGVSYASAIAEKPVATGNNDELAPVWQTARNKRPKPAVKPPAASKRDTRRPAVTTRNSDVGGRKLPIKAAMRLANVFVSRLGPDETEATIKTYLETTLKLDVKVELCKLSNTQSSFHITSVCPMPSVFMADDIWPVGVYRRWWRQQRTESTDPDTSVNTAGIHRWQHWSTQKRQ